MGRKKGDLPALSKSTGFNGFKHEPLVNPNATATAFHHELRRKFSHSHGVDADCGLRLHGVGPLVDFSTLAKYSELRDRVHMRGIPGANALHNLTSPVNSSKSRKPKIKPVPMAVNLSEFMQ
jgi:hypothetical protein